MGIQKQNVPTRFDEETLGLIDWDRAQHKMTRSQYVRESMIKWLRLRMAGTVQLLDAFAQQEQRNNCLPREQREQSLQIEFPAQAFPVEGRAKKPLVRVGPSKTGSHQRREFAYVSRTVSMATVPSGITFFPKHLQLNSTRIDGRVA